MLSIISTGIFLSVIDIFIVNVAVPSIKKGIHGSDTDIQLVIALYLLGYAVFLIAGGRAGDFYGKKKVYILSILLFTIASALCGISQTALQLNLARLAQGISAAFMVPQGISYIQVLFPDLKERAKAFGIYGTIAGTASVIGQLLGGLLPDTTLIAESWRLIFFINIPVGLFAAILAFKYLPDHKVNTQVRFDFSGAIILSISLAGLILPVIIGRELHWPLWSLLLLVVSIVMFYILFIDQKRKQKSGDDSLINFELFKFRDFNLGICASLLYFLVQDTYFLINTVLLQTGFGISSSKTGLFFVIQGLGYMFASLLSVRFVARYGKYVLISGILVMVLSLVCHIYFLKPDDINLQIILPVLFTYGMGCGTVLSSLLTVTLKTIPPQFAGAASGTYSTFQQTAIALGIGCLGGIFYKISGTGNNVSAFLEAYRITTIINIFLLLFTGFFLSLLPSQNNGSK